MIGHSNTPPILFETMIFYGPARKLERLDLTPEGRRKLFEERQALIDTLPPKQQELVDYQDRYPPARSGTRA